jgi:hypothetical protein
MTRLLVVVLLAALVAPLEGPGEPTAYQVAPGEPGALVERAYRDLLGRSPDEAGRAYWEGVLEAGGDPRSVIAWIGDSPEHRTHVVRMAYRQILRREPDQGGAAWWADALGDRMTRLGLQASLFGSAEYGATAGGSGEGFVTALYRDVLRRSPEPEGLAYWTGLVDEGVDRVTVAATVLESPEAALQPELSILTGDPVRHSVTSWFEEITVRLDREISTASHLRVTVDGVVLDGSVERTVAGDALVFRPDDLAARATPGETVPVIVTVLGDDGDRIERVGYHFHLAVPAPQVVGSSTTPLVPGQPRNANIRLAADLIDGDVIRAGESYSLNQGIGPRTTGRGFQPNGYIDEDGDVISVTGGGVSQMGTTFLNAAWFAGIALDEFRPHTIWFERYPMCREATLAWNVLDVVVTNDTPFDLTIRTGHAGSSVTVMLVGVPWAEVDSWIGEPFNTGAPGGPFSVRCGRTVTRTDGATTSESWSWRYREGFPG